MSGFTSGDALLIDDRSPAKRAHAHEGRFVNRPFYWVRPERPGIRLEQQEAFLLKEIDLWEIISLRDAFLSERRGADQR